MRCGVDWSRITHLSQKSSSSFFCSPSSFQIMVHSYSVNELLGSLRLECDSFTTYARVFFVRDGMRY